MFNSKRIKELEARIAKLEGLSIIESTEQEAYTYFFGVAAFRYKKYYLKDALLAILQHMGAELVATPEVKEKLILKVNKPTRKK